MFSLQADVAPLMSVLLGIPFPVNSVVSYLNLLFSMFKWGGGGGELCAFLNKIIENEDRYLYVGALLLSYNFVLHLKV